VADHVITPERGSLHGDFSAARPPVMTIESGDRVAFQTLEAGWRLMAPTGDEDRTTRFEPRDPATDGGHALCGPVAVRGARPGMTLAVHIEEIRPGPWGLTPVGGWDSPSNRRLGVAEAPQLMMRWAIDTDAGICRNQFGHEVTMHPFMGVMGLPPAAPHPVPTAPPRVQGGNLDCRELIAGSTLYLPIAVEGALFSTGDGHAAQGDGELCGTAIECPMDRVALRFELLDDMPLTTPRARTPSGWLSLGFHEDLDEAVALATDDMLALMGDRLGIDRMQAMGLASLIVDLRVTQMVNGVKGAHAMLAHEALARLAGNHR
jgi:acetamidase/formamidase